MIGMYICPECGAIMNSYTDGVHCPNCGHSASYSEIQEKEWRWE